MPRNVAAVGGSQAPCTAPAAATLALPTAVATAAAASSVAAAVRSRGRRGSHGNKGSGGPTVAAVQGSPLLLEEEEGRADFEKGRQRLLKLKEVDLRTEIIRETAESL